MLNYQRVPGFVPFFGDSTWRSYKINMEYPLVICHSSLLNITTSNNGKSTITGPCSIVFCMFTRGYVHEKNHDGDQWSFFCAMVMPQAWRHWVGPNIELYHVEIYYHDYSCLFIVVTICVIVTAALFWMCVCSYCLLTGYHPFTSYFDVLQVATLSIAAALTFQGRSMISQQPSRVTAKLCVWIRPCMCVLPTWRRCTCTWKIFTKRRPGDFGGFWTLDGKSVGKNLQESCVFCSKLLVIGFSYRISVQPMPFERWGTLESRATVESVWSSLDGTSWQGCSKFSVFPLHIPLNFLNWLVAWNDFYDFPFSWECHHPSWRTPSFFRGVGWNHQPATTHSHYTDLTGMVFDVFLKEIVRIGSGSFKSFLGMYQSGKLNGWGRRCAFQLLWLGG